MSAARGRVGQKLTEFNSPSLVPVDSAPNGTYPAAAAGGTTAAPTAAAPTTPPSNATSNVNASGVPSAAPTFAPSSAVNATSGGTCTDTRPATSNLTITLRFWTIAPGTGITGQACPVACDFANATANAVVLSAEPASAAACVQWPGGSGEDSASNFSCDVPSASFSLTQWTSCTCSGGSVPAGTRKQYSTNYCIVDTPSTLCARIEKYTGCLAFSGQLPNATTAPPASAPSTPPSNASNATTAATPTVAPATAPGRTLTSADVASIKADIVNLFGLVPGYG